MNSKISALLRISISLGLVLFLLWSMRGRSSQILSTLQKTNIMLFSIGAILFILNVCILSFRLGILFQGEGLNIHLARVMQLSFIGYFFNNFLPTAVGGDVVKAYYAYKQTKEPAKSFIAVFMDRFIGLFSFMLLAVIALFFAWDRVDIMLKRIVFLFAISGVGMLFVILNAKVAKIILKIL